MLPGQPLGLATFGSKVLVLLREPHYFLCYDWDGQSCDLPPALADAQQLAVQQAIQLPTAILERDTFDNLKMSKNAESRGPIQVQPWNDAARKQIAVEKRSRSRHKRRRRDRKSNDRGDPEEEVDQDKEEAQEKEQANVE